MKWRQILEQVEYSFKFRILRNCKAAFKTRKTQHHCTFSYHNNDIPYINILSSPTWNKICNDIIEMFGLQQLTMLFLHHYRVMCFCLDHFTASKQSIEEFHTHIYHAGFEGIFYWITFSDLWRLDSRNSQVTDLESQSPQNPQNIYSFILLLCLQTQIKLDTQKNILSKTNPD